MSARILTCSQAEYFADPCDVPSLSQSIAHTLISQSPLHAWQEHPRLGGIRSAPTAATNDGQLIHKLVLGKGSEIELVAADDFRTKAAREARDAAVEAGRLPILEHKFEAARTVADTIVARLEAQYGITFSGESEVPFEWNETGEHGPIVCRGLMDHVIVSDGAIYDVKKIVSAHPDTCGRHVWDYGYAIQQAAYTSCLAKYVPELEGRIRMKFLFMEIEPPYAIVPGELDGVTRELGEMQWQRAYSTWERCLHNNNWPSYCDTGSLTISAPLWALRKEMEVNGEW